MHISNFLSEATRYLFFTGKGGVGKTTLASATAITLAEQGNSVLLVSTDPASNLDEVLETPLASEPTPIATLPKLHALNIDPEAAAHDYRERIVGPIRGVLPEATVKNIEEQLSGACTTEIASFNEFSKLLGTPEKVAAYDYVILDTAPTGHTLRLLALPAAWNDFIAENKTGSSCLGPLSGLAEQKDVYQRALNALQNPKQTTIALVARADRPSLNEAERARAELTELGINRQTLLINALFQAADPDDPLARAMQERAADALDNIPPSLAQLPRYHSPYRVSGLAGIERLKDLYRENNDSAKPAAEPPPPSQHPDIDHLVESIAAQNHGVIMTMGKGGVGKTTLAKRIALELAARGKRTHLTTTDPANHIEDLRADKELPLSISAIDPKKVTEQHVQTVLASSRETLDANALALLEEELRSPCIEEIAVFTAFAHEVAKGEDQFVVLDTAPTGHTLLLLDTTEAYHREVTKNTQALPEAVQRLLPRLRDPEFTKTIVVALPEATPVHEAAQLQKDLRRAGIEPHAWIVNQCIDATQTTDPRLLAKAKHEHGYIHEVAQRHATRYAICHWTPEPSQFPQSKV